MKKHKKLGVDELRNFPGFESFTNEEAERAIKTLEGLSILFYELFMKSENVKQLNQEDHETKRQPAA
jgi:hypothetical protein